MIVAAGLSTKIEIDGGVSLDNAKLLTDAGADVLVAGNTVFASENPSETISKLLNLTK
jgi:ribulose-phosphate 3-epimerase